MSRHRGPSAVPSDEVRGIANVLHSQQDLLERHRLLLLAPPKRSRQAFVLCNITKISIRPGEQSKHRSIASRSTIQTKHTEKILHQRPLRRPSLRVSERNYRRRQLAQTELLHRRRESVRRVKSTGIDLAEELAVGELLGREDAGGPELLGGGEGGGVEEVVVAVVGVHAAVFWWS